MIDDEFEGIGDGDNGQAGYSEGFYKCRNLFEFISIKMQNIKGICTIFARNLFSGVVIKLNRMKSWICDWNNIFVLYWIKTDIYSKFSPDTMHLNYIIRANIVLTD